MLTQQGKRVKTDKRDALMIAQCLSYGGPIVQFMFLQIKMSPLRNTFECEMTTKGVALKKIKQQINAFCLRQGYFYAGNKWTIKHLNWLKKLVLSDLYRETLNEYLTSYEEQTARWAIR